MTFSSTEISHLNKMNRASKDVTLGTVVNDLITSASSSSGTLATHLAALPTQIVSGSYAFVANDLLGATITNIAAVAGAKSYFAEFRRSGSPVSASSVSVVLNATGSYLQVKSGSSLIANQLATGDIINYMVIKP